MTPRQAGHRRHTGGRPDSSGVPGRQQIEGRQAVTELLRAGRRRVHDVWMAEGTDAAPILDEIVDLASRRRVRVIPVSRARLEAEARTDAPQGVLAHADALPEADLDDLCRGEGGQAKRTPFLLALDSVSDPRNVGALMRSAEAAGATGAVLPRHRSAGVTPAAAKAAAGAFEWLPVATVGGMPAALARARELGCWIVGLDPEGEQSLFELTLATEPVMIVVGAEGPGLSRLVRQRCDVLAHVPMGGHLASLNASAAGTLALFEVARRRRSAGHDPVSH